MKLLTSTAVFIIAVLLSASSIGPCIGQFQNLRNLVQLPVDLLGGLSSAAGNGFLEPAPAPSPPVDEGRNNKRFSEVATQKGATGEDEDLEKEILALKPEFEAVMESAAAYHNRSIRQDGGSPLFGLLNGNLGKLLSSVLPDLSFLRPLERAYKRGEESTRAITICHACKIGAQVAMVYLRGLNNPYELLDFVRQICPVISIKQNLCEGLIREYGKQVIYIVTTRKELRAERACGMFLQSFGCDTTDPHVHWDVLDDLSDLKFSDDDRLNRVGRQGVVGEEREAVEEEDSSSDVEEAPQPHIGPSTKILQLTDIHMDPWYKPGSETKCKLEACCRGPQIYGRGRAGYYGDYRNCDLPYHTFELALKHIAETHPDISMIYMTGDMIAHTGFGSESSIEEIQSVLANVTQTIMRFFPNTPVVPVMGNHDTHPMNLFSPPGAPSEVSNGWIFPFLAKTWSKWLPANAVESFLQGGHYAVEVDPQFKILVISNNYCFLSNLWLVYEDRDPFGQLHWLATELKTAEAAGQKVHIVGHIPPNFEGCWLEWSENYYRILSRFRSTVVAQFFGHTHHDDFGLFYDPKKPAVPIGSFWIGASLTPYVNLNPGYKIYTLDSARGEDSTHKVLDHETWIFNLTEANRNPRKPPRWYKLYQATEAYDLDDLSPASLHKFVMRMSEEEGAFKEYYRHFYKATDAAGPKDCDSTCRKIVLCCIVTPSFKQFTRCMLMDNEDEAANEVLPRGLFRARAGRMEPWAGHRVMGPRTRNYFLGKDRFKK